MIKNLAISCLAARPVWHLLRHRALRGNPLTIMCYHTLGPDSGGIDGWTVVPQGEFKSQLADLRAHYDIVSLDDALSGRVHSDRPQAVITFDDGDSGLYTYLRPILRETPIPVTLYVATEQIQTGRPFWFDRVVNALQGSGEVNVDGLGRWQVPSENGKARWAVLGDILNTLKQADPDLRNALADQVAIQGTDTPEPRLGPMTLEHLKELADTPGVTIGAHSHGHELLDQITLEQARNSIARSRKLLQGWTGQDVRHFAFPNGNHSEALRNVARHLGFTSATILGEQTVPCGCDPFALPRISVGRYDSRSRVRLRLAGL